MKFITYRTPDENWYNEIFLIKADLGTLELKHIP